MKIVSKLTSVLLAVTLAAGIIPQAADYGIDFGTTAYAEEVEFSLDKTSIKLAVGEKDRIYVSNASNRSQIWTSDNEDSVTVDNYGNLTAKKEGKATVSVLISKKYTLECQVEVCNIRIGAEKSELFIGDSTKLKIYGDKKSAGKYTWFSSKEEVAEVVDGKLTAKATGKASVGIIAGEGTKYTCTVKVSQKKLTAPVVTAASAGNNGFDTIVLKWEAVPEAESYTIYFSETKGGEYRPVSTVKDTSYTRKNLKNGKKYYFKVKANASGAKSVFSKIVSAATKKVNKSKAQLQEDLEKKQAELIAYKLLYGDGLDKLDEMKAFYENDCMELIKDCEADLKRVKSQKNVRIYNSETGNFEWQADPKAVERCEKNLEEAKEIANDMKKTINEMKKKLKPIFDLEDEVEVLQRKIKSF